MKKRLHPISFVRSGARKRLVQTLGEFGQNLRASGPNELAIANIIPLVIGELEQKPVPEACMCYSLYGADSNLYEQENLAFRNSPADCFSEEPGCRVGKITDNEINIYD